MTARDREQAMQRDRDVAGRAGRGEDQADVPFGSNDVRLSPREWLVAAAITVAVFGSVPIVWEHVEEFELEEDHRTPFSLSYDYWMYDRYCRSVCAGDKTLVLGDSVIWGHYVKKGHTLSHYLNEQAHQERFANMGVDGTHPAALAGLIEYYGRDVSGKSVILHCNLLWMSSKRRDLQTKKESPFNHPRLVPQFSPRIPCYKETDSRRIGIVIERYVDFFGWAEHLRCAYFDNTDIPRWTVSNPYRNPIGAITLKLPSPDEPPDPKPAAKPWTQQKDIRRYSPPWVDLEGATLSVEEILDWQAFCAKLSEQGGRAGQGAAARVWGSLSPAVRDSIRSAGRWISLENTDKSYWVELEKSGIVGALNVVLARRDFYRAESFRAIDIPPEAKDLLKYDRRSLPLGKVRHLNRVLLEAVFPGEIATRKPSFQWRSFQRITEILKSRRNRVFVLVGPFNEHMLKAQSRATYEERKEEVGFWLREKKIPHAIPPALPSNLYADASHPLADGYAGLAKMLFANEAFARFDARRRAGDAEEANAE